MEVLASSSSRKRSAPETPVYPSKRPEPDDLSFACTSDHIDEDGDNQDVRTLTSSESQFARICSGALVDIPCKVLHNGHLPTPEELGNSHADEHHIKLNLALLGDRCQIAIADSDPIANLKRDVGTTLLEIDKIPSVDFVAYGSMSLLTKAFTRDAKGKWATQISINVNIYSDGYQGSSIGSLLSKNGLFLQEPDWIEPDMEVQNPHILTFTGLSDAEVLVNELTLSSRLSQTADIDTDWNTILDDLGTHQSSTAAIDFSHLAVPLKDHQVVGVEFMSQREMGSLDQSQKYWRPVGNDEQGIVFQHIVTHAERSNRQGELAEPRSGILADEMGLGKTFTVLALAASSLGRAETFAGSQPEFDLRTSGLWAASKTTLVVVPSLLILDNWIRDTEQKLKLGSVKFSVYHGANRVRHYTELLPFDLVFTTYGTIAKEFRRQKAREVLYKIRWFRIVLDEVVQAHVIRSETTRQFKAIISLQAQHHWCLTGTPISNKIDDLGALIRFCRVPMLEDRSCFRAHVVKTMKRQFRAGNEAVHKTLAPLCLRRTRKVLNLPEPRHVHHIVKLPDIERQHYRALMDTCRKALDATVSGRSAKRSTMLQAILQLRIFCDLGTFHPNARLQDEEGLDPDEALSLLQQKDQARCTECSCEVHVINQLEIRESGIFASCSHILCRICYDACARSAQSSQFVCPSCETDVQERSLQPWLPEPGCSDDRQSTKLNRLIQDLEESQGHEKSLVLSGWKKTIDLASSLCKAKGIKHVRIDGSVPQQDRTARLQQFVDDETTSALLMTMGTGALGLNITAATRVHILEPQWNPSVEQQAIGRSVRIGQENETTVIRYTVEDTVEEQVQLYQKYKIRLSAGGFGDNSEASADAHTRLLSATFFQKG